jgi:hypothetical protein
MSGTEFHSPPPTISTGTTWSVGEFEPDLTDAEALKFLPSYTETPITATEAAALVGGGGSPGSRGRAWFKFAGQWTATT